MKKTRFLFSLLMAIVMMAMSPQRMWAEEECTHEWEQMDNSIHLCKKCDSFESHKIDEDGGTCVCGFVCPEHDFSIDTDAIYNELKTTGKHILASKCNYCHYVVSEDLEDLIYGACDAGYEQHDWFVDLVLPTCTNKGYSVYICNNCTFAYYDDFTDADPDAHYFYPGDDGQHYCKNGCGQSGAHTMEEERCTVCGYWPGHTEHDWDFDDFDHQCIIPGCDEFGWFAPHEFDGCECTICGYATHKYENGKCVKCNSECEHDWEFFNDYSHSCNKCYYGEHHKIDEDGGTCVCGYKCSQHDYKVDINETRQACVNNSKIIVVYRCDHCNHSKTEEVEIESVCENGDKHSWVESNYEATCKNSGYTKVKCFDCRLEYYKNFTDINPDAHSWDAYESEHRCSNKCEAYYEWESHEYDENGQCEVCGYWPDHEQHRWETTKKGHHCSIPGCEVYGEWSDHTFDVDGKCTICGAEAIYEATVTIGGNTTSYLDFNDALTDAIDAGSAATVVLQSDVALPGNKVYWLDENNRIILDLNGKTLKFESENRLFSLKGCNLTITDSSEEKEGTIESYNTILDAYLGTLTIHAGTFKSRYHQALRINTSQLSVTIDGGRFITGSTDCSSISTVQQPDPAEGYYYVATGSGNFLSPGDDGNLVDQDGNIVTDITVIHQHSFADADTDHTHCTTCGHYFIRYTTNDGEDLANIETYASDAINHDFDPVSGSGYLEYDFAVTEINGEIFNGCANLATIILPSTVETIGSGAFWLSGLTSITIPEGVTSIGNSAFKECSSLTSISMGYVEEFGVDVFWGCSDDLVLSVPCDYTFDFGTLGLPESATVNRVHDGELTTYLAEEATCERAGNDEYTACDRCAEFACEAASIPPLDHTFKLIQDENDETAAQCEVCQNIYYEYGCPGYHNDHDISIRIEPYKQATCTESGYTGSIYCDNCEEYILEGEEIPALSHIFGDVKKLGDDGYHHYACTRQGCETLSDAKYAKMFGDYKLVTDDENPTETIQLTKVGNYYYTSLYTDFPYTMSEDVEALEANDIQDDKVMFWTVTDIIPANCGIILRSQTKSKCTITYDAAGAYLEDRGERLLTGSETEVSEPADNQYAFGLSDTGYLGFWHWSGMTIPAWKAYLDLGSETATEARGFRIVFDDETNGIQQLPADASAIEGCYDLMGHKVREVKGLGIVNGRKVYVK